MAFTALKITLYDPETNEEKKTYTRTFVPWKLLKSAMGIAEKIKPGENVNPEMADAIAALVVDTFGGQFTVDELNDGADLGEMMTVVHGIVSRAKGVGPGNPTLPR